MNNNPIISDVENVFKIREVKTIFKIHGTVTIRTIDGSDEKIIDVIDGTVSPWNDLEYIPFQFGTVDFFDFANKGLSSLKGCPHAVTGDFDVSKNELTTLIGGPRSVLGSYYVFNNPLTDLDGAPDEVGHTFTLSWSENIPLLRLLKYDRFHIFGGPNTLMREYAGQKPLRQAIIQCQKKLIDAGFKGNARL